MPLDDHEQKILAEIERQFYEEDPELARRACDAIKVEYEVLPAVLDPEKAMAPGAPVIHDQADASGIKDPKRNLAAEIVAEVGDVAKGFAEAERVFEESAAPEGYRLGGVALDDVAAVRKMTKLWGDEAGRATKTDRILVLGATESGRRRALAGADVDVDWTWPPRLARAI